MRFGASATRADARAALPRISNFPKRRNHLATIDPLALPAAPVSGDPFALPEAAEKADILAVMAPIEDWLAQPPDTVSQPDISPVIETQKFAARYDALRFQVMKGTHRVWACDGEYVACRPRDF